MNYIKHYLTTLFLITALFTTTTAQTIYNDGATITIQENANVYVNGSVEEASGHFDHYGNLYVNGNWTEAQAQETGTVYLNGDDTQIIQTGSFPNLDLTEGTGLVQGGATIYGELNMGDRVWDLSWSTLQFWGSSPTTLNVNNGAFTTPTTGVTGEVCHIFTDVADHSGETYTIPFRSDSGIDIPYTVVVTAQNGGTVICMSTMTTNDDNTPYPSQNGDIIVNMDYNGTDISSYMIDRYWGLRFSLGEAAVSITYDPADFVGNTYNPANLSVMGLFYDFYDPVGDIAHYVWQEVASTQVGNTFTFATDPSNEAEAYTLADISDLTPTPGITFGIKLFLEGAYDTNTEVMTTILRDNNLIPIEQPFARPPWNYNGLESVADMASIPVNAVDWLLIELRSAADQEQIVAQRACFLMSEGSVQDINGTEGVFFSGLNDGNYYVIARSRNHLANITENAIVLSSAGSVLVNFNDPTMVLGGTAQLKSIAGQYAQIAGDFNSDGVLTVTDFNFYATQTSQINQYLDGDVNLDKAVTVADFNLYQPNSSVIGVNPIRY